MATQGTREMKKRRAKADERMGERTELRQSGGGTLYKAGPTALPTSDTSGLSSPSVDISAKTILLPFIHLQTLTAACNHLYISDAQQTPVAE